MTIVDKFLRRIWDKPIQTLDGREMKNLKVLAKPLVGPEMIQWYPDQPKISLVRKYHKVMNIPYFDEFEEERIAKLKMMKARGKSAPPKKKK